jgi:hypothetical protein
MPSPRDPLNRRLAVVAAPVPLSAIAYTVPATRRAVAAAVQAGWEITIGPEAGLDELAAEEAVRAGGAPLVALPHRPPPSHWTRLLRAVYGEAVRWLWCDREMRRSWAGMARVHYPELDDPDSVAMLATAHAAVERATLALVLPPATTMDVIVDHARWVCRLLDIRVIDLATVGGLTELHHALPKE